MTKICVRCSEEKPPEAFYHQVKSEDGLSPHCRACQKLYKAAYHAKNRDRLNAANKLRHHENRDIVLAKKREYSLLNRDEILAKQRTPEYRAKARNWRRERYKKNPEQILKWNRDSSIRTGRQSNCEYNAKRTPSPEAKLNAKIASILRSRMWKAVKSRWKAGSAVRDLGCSIEELRLHLEALFEPGMSWENWNRKGWHIDHIQPLASFDLTDRDQFLKASHYTNLQPLWAIANQLKGSRS